VHGAAAVDQGTVIELYGAFAVDQGAVAELAAAVMTAARCTAPPRSTRVR
jgi:hypothetical protein